MSTIYIPLRYRGGKPSRYCSPENPYQGFCKLPSSDKPLWVICQRCGSHWFTVRNPLGSWAAQRNLYHWERLETYLFRAAVVGLKLKMEDNKR